MDGQEDLGYNYVMNALFTPLDMTDYEDYFVGMDEVQGNFPITNTHLLKQDYEGALPPIHALATQEILEERPMLARGRTHKDYLDMKKAEEDAGEEEDEDEEEEAEGEGEEGGEEEAAEDYGEEVEDPDAWNPTDVVPNDFYEDKYFVHGENLKSRFNEVELGAFMKLLNVKPVSQWQDDSVHHYKMGVHTYEDNAQELDPTYHILGEVEREHAERI